MDQQIDIFEYNWWNSFISYLVLLISSLALIAVIYYGVNLVIYPLTDYRRLALLRLLLLGALSCVGIIASMIGVWVIRNVPKLIIFRQNNIFVVTPLGREKVFRYEDIVRIRILQSSTNPSQRLKTSWFANSMTIYFVGQIIKLNPNRLVNYSLLLAHLKEKKKELSFGIFIE